MDNFSMGNLDEYVKSVTNSKKVIINKKNKKEKEIDEKKYKAILADIKKQTANIIKQTEKAYNLKSQKQLYDFLIHMEVGLSKLN